MQPERTLPSKALTLNGPGSTKVYKGIRSKEKSQTIGQKLEVWDSVAKQYIWWSKHDT